MSTSSTASISCFGHAGFVDASGADLAPCVNPAVVAATGLIAFLDGRRALSATGAVCASCLLAAWDDPDFIPGSIDGFVLRPLGQPDAPGVDAFTVQAARAFLAGGKAGQAATA